MGSERQEQVDRSPLNRGRSFAQGAKGAFHHDSCLNRDPIADMMVTTTDYKPIDLTPVPLMLTPAATPTK